MRVHLDDNFFDLFGLPQTYDIDPGRLAQHYRELQRGTHPDKFMQASASERHQAVRLTAHLNEAFQTLKDPIKRGRYLLQLRGVETNEETDTVMDADFLMEQITLREALEQARMAPNRAEHLEKLSVQLATQQREKETQLRRALADSTPSSLTTARQRVREMQFIAKLADEVRVLDDED